MAFLCEIKYIKICQGGMPRSQNEHFNHKTVQCFQAMISSLFPCYPANMLLSALTWSDQVKWSGRSRWNADSGLFSLLPIIVFLCAKFSGGFLWCDTCPAEIGLWLQAIFLKPQNNFQMVTADHYCLSGSAASKPGTLTSPGNSTELPYLTMK